MCMGTIFFLFCELSFSSLNCCLSILIWFSIICFSVFCVPLRNPWSWNPNTLATSCEELTHWKRPWYWDGLGAGEEGDDRGWDGWMASATRWTWVWVNSGSWWWTGRPGVLWFTGSQGVRHDWATELNWRNLWLQGQGVLLCPFSECFHCFTFQTLDSIFYMTLSRSPVYFFNITKWPSTIFGRDQPVSLHDSVIISRYLVTEFWFFLMIVWYSLVCMCHK